jgi:hypothetical protein
VLSPISHAAKKPSMDVPPVPLPLPVPLAPPLPAFEAFGSSISPGGSDDEEQAAIASGEPSNVTANRQIQRLQGSPVGCLDPLFILQDSARPPASSATRRRS